MSKAETHANSTVSIPIAIIQSKSTQPRGTRLWWLAVAAAVVSLAIILTSLRSTGPTVTLYFSDGHGLKPGDALKYRGIVLGEVTDVELAADRNRVMVKVRLDPRARSLPRRDSRFWIERPRVSVARVSGLETVVGPKFIGMIPGPDSGPLKSEFDGLDSPPMLAQSDSAFIAIRFREGNGLQVGAPVRYRGVDVGEVTSIDLTSELNSVSVKVRLVGEAHQLAREGTQFWIERPQLSMAEVRGLDTLIGGRYLSVAPGPIDAPEQTQFEGIESNALPAIPEGSLEIILHAPQRWGVERGVPVLYRGLNVGKVISVGLASDGTNVEVRAWIDAQYRSLVRQNSVFWSQSGVDVNFGFSGLRVTADTLTSVAMGGVAFATPSDPGAPVGTGQRFPYHKSPKDEWLTWQPHIAPATDHLPSQLPLPSPERAVAHWGERNMLIQRNRERTGLVIRLENGMLLGPADLLAPTDLSTSRVTLEWDGKEFLLTGDKVQRIGRLAAFTANDQTRSGHDWPLTRVRQASSPEDCMIVSDPHTPPLPIAASSLQPHENNWEIRATSGLTPALHGSAVVSTKDGSLIGQLIMNEKKPTIALFERLPGSME